MTRTRSCRCKRSRSRIKNWSVVVAVIRRGLKDGAKIQELEERLGNLAAAVMEAKRRLVALNRVGQEIVSNYRRAIDPQRKHPLTQLEAFERMKWLQEKSDELKGLLE